jgi:hypothetical protein
MTIDFINDACADKRYLLKQLDVTIITRRVTKEENISDAIVSGAYTSNENAIDGILSKKVF